MLRTLFACTVLIMCSLISVTLAQEHYCSSSNVTLLHWNVTDPSFPNSPYPLYFPQLPDLQFMVDIDGAPQPMKTNDNIYDALKGTTFSMMFHVVKNKEDKAFYKTVYVMNSKHQGGSVQKLMDCNIRVAQNEMAYCDGLTMLPNTVTTEGKNQYSLWNIISGRQFGSGDLSSSIIPYLYTSDITSYGVNASITDAIAIFPIILTNVDKDPIYAKDGSISGYETLTSANNVTSNIFVKPILLLDVINNQTNQNEILALHKSDANAIRIIRITPFHESFGITSQYLLVPSIQSETLKPTMVQNNARIVYSSKRGLLHAVVTLYKDQQVAFENYHRLEHDKFIKFSSNAQFVNVLITLDASDLSNLKVVKVSQILTANNVKSTAELLASGNVKTWKLNDITLSGDSEQYVVVVGTMIYTAEGETDKNGFIYTVNIDDYTPFQSTPVAERFSLITDDEAQISNSDALTVTANFYGLNDTIAVGSVIRTKLKDDPFYVEPKLVGYVHLYSASNLDEPLGSKIMRENQGINRLFKVEYFPGQSKDSHAHIFLGWNINDNGAVVSTLSFSCIPKVIRDGWQYMLIGVFGGEFLICVLIGVIYFVVKKVRAKFTANKEYEQV
ncbi:hypothetical protein NAEGRDRAFT_79328 [Naegleria gruberi]|uniref:Uncharacterized protein n=1 Tax=Naegleria gruberi TaxID=5762 RepID=D2VBL8_NAEGR|nr:uncharacterized protein NAEGRDRAFT_79328 [Naegleria gruberi]EFC45818.1 hypothetical protein NAEGRDRAFT_79328 [Naegleria gruberi]|eukprot:XP_002678562.1 hypothetical protein NAEGRDRAFT_79328 [Naegleria gruberi strain NEG-M]